MKTLQSPVPLRPAERGDARRLRAAHRLGAADPAPPEGGSVDGAMIGLGLPPGWAPPGRTVVATQNALDLVTSLRSLDRSYTAVAAEAGASAAD